MKRLTLWLIGATVLSQAIGNAYRSGLAHATEAMFLLLGQHVTVNSLELLSPLDLAFFLALCGGATRTPWSRRASAAAIGSTVLLAVELALCLAMVYTAHLDANLHALPAAMRETRNAILASYTWVLPPAVWLALLGHPAVRAQPRTGERPRRIQAG